MKSISEGKLMTVAKILPLPMLSLPPLHQTLPTPAPLYRALVRLLVLALEPRSLPQRHLHHRPLELPVDCRGNPTRMTSNQALLNYFPSSVMSARGLTQRHHQKVTEVAISKTRLGEQEAIPVVRRLQVLHRL